MIAATGTSGRSGIVTSVALATSIAAAIRSSQSMDTVRMPVSSRPMVCAVVGGTQAAATSAKVSPRALRTSRMRVIILPHSDNRFG